MAMTELLLAWLGTLAVAATALAGWFAMNAARVEKWTRVLVEFAASVLWALFAVSAMDVIVPSGASTPVSESIYPMVFLGIGFALVTFVYFLYDLVVGISEAASESDLEETFDVR